MKRILGFVILILICACSPKPDNPNTIVQKISTHYGEPVDSVKKHIKILDSSFIKSLGLSFYYFTESTNKPNSEVIGGQIVIDNSTNNYYVYSWIGMPLGFFYEDSLRKNCSPLSPFTFSGASWQILKLESILNNLSVEAKRNITRNNMDSFFRFSYLGIYLHNSQIAKQILVTTRQSFDSIFTNIFLMHPVTYKPNIDGEKMTNRKAFKMFVDDLFSNGNFYLYYLPNGCPEHFRLFTINEEFTNDSLAVSYNRNCSNETSLFNIKLYDVSQ